MFGLGGQELVILGLVGVLVIGAFVFLVGRGLFGPPKFSRDDEPNPREPR